MALALAVSDVNKLSIIAILLLSGTIPSSKGDKKSEDPRADCKMEEIDFASGESSCNISINLLENFIDLSITPIGLEDSQKASEYAVSVLKEAIKPLKAEILFTGSVAENVCAPYMGVSVYGFPVPYAPEIDTMTVINIELLIGSMSTHRVQLSSTGNPCFVTIAMTPSKNKQSDTDEYQGGALLFNSRIAKNTTDYISPRRFIKYIKQQMEFCTLWVEKRNIFNTYEVFEHGPAIQVQERKGYESFTYYPQTTNPDCPQEGRKFNEKDVDIVPALQLPDWPAAAIGWITRSRKWPDKSMVDEIVAHGVMVVAKPPRGGNEMLDWRLSFSRAEVALLVNTEAPCKQQAHRIFKYIIKHMISPSFVLSSYHCKTVTLWATERHPAHYWQWHTLGHCVLGLLDDMIRFIAEKNCPHYFIPEVNLFENIPDDFLHTAGQQLVNIRRNPITKLPPLTTYTEQYLTGDKPFEDRMTTCSHAILATLKQLKSAN